MMPVEIDDYLFDLYKGGNGRIVLTIMDGRQTPRRHVDVDVSALHRALATLLPQFCEPLAEDPDLEEATTPLKSRMDRG